MPRGVSITGLIGQYAHGNEPSHHICYADIMAGRELVFEMGDQKTVFWK